MASSLTSVLRRDIGLLLVVEVGSLSGLGMVVMRDHSMFSGREPEEAAELRRLVRWGERMLANCLYYSLTNPSSPGDLLQGRDPASRISSPVNGFDSCCS